MARWVVIFGCGGLLGTACGPSASTRALWARYRSGDYAGVLSATESNRASATDQALRIRAAVALGERAQIGAAVEVYLAHGGRRDAALWRELADVTIAAALASGDVEVQLTAIGVADEFAREAVAPDVTALLEATDDRVKAAAAVAVLKGAMGAAHVAEAMLTSPDDQAREIAVRGVGTEVGKLALRDLQRATRDPSARVRAAAASVLGAWDPTSVVRLTKDAQPTVRAAAFRALPTNDDLLTQALADADRNVRVAGLSAVTRDAKRGTSPQIERLTATVRDADLVVALAAADALAAVARHHKAARALIDSPSGTLSPIAEPIERAVVSDVPELRRAAITVTRALMGADAARTMAQRLVADADLPTRALALAEVGSVDSMAQLVALVESQADADAATRVAILAAAMPRARGQEIAPTLLRAWAALALHPVASIRARAITGQASVGITSSLVAALADPALGNRVTAARMMLLATAAR